VSSGISPGTYTMEHFAQNKTKSNGGSLPFSGVSGTERKKHYYFVTTNDDPPYALQHVWAGPDETGWSTAINALMKVSRGPKFVAWVDSIDGAAIKKEFGSVIRNTMFSRVTEDVDAGMPYESVDYGKKAAMPNIDEWVRASGEFPFFTRRWDGKIGLSAVQLKDDDLFDCVESFRYISRRKEFICWANSEEAVRYANEHKHEFTPTLALLVKNSFSEILRTKLDPYFYPIYKVGK
jgi:hypothetical protein